MLEELAPDSLTPADLSQAVVSACDAYQVEAGPGDRPRGGDAAGARGHQYLVYKLRADEDFGYD